MLKLNKIQIEAIVNKIYNDINTEVKKFNKTISEQKEDFINRKINRYPILQNCTGMCETYAVRIIEQKFKNEIEDFEIKMKKSPLKSSIEQDLILASIDKDSLDEIVANIVAKYQ